MNIKLFYLAALLCPLPLYCHTIESQDEHHSTENTRPRIRLNARLNIRLPQRQYRVPLTRGEHSPSPARRSIEPGDRFNIHRALCP